MLNEIIGAILQVAVFMLIPFLVYLITKRKAKGFWDYIGLKRSNQKANLLAVAACLVFVLPIMILLYFSADFKEIMFDPKSVTGKFRAMGFSGASLFLVMVHAIFKTSFAEEVLFRGFLAKRLIAWLGYQWGNIVQASLFAALHSAIFMTITDDIGFLIFIFLAPFAGAYISVYLNEKVANGSIIPGWISHGLANVLAYSIVGFML